jgi:hypothetical protein
LKFIIELHPCLNQTDVTIVTDQDKGLFSAITEEVSEAVNFHCSYHRSQNIIKMCSAKSGNKVNSALWVYTRLLQCRSVAQLEREKVIKIPVMHRTDLPYLNSLSDESQYPAARCAKAPGGVYMYHCTSSAAVESMNAANREMRAKTAVDPLNACILLLRMECKRFISQRRLAWAMETELTSRGKVEYDVVFTNISSFDFTINVSEDCWTKHALSRGLSMPKAEWEEQSQSGRSLSVDPISENVRVALIHLMQCHASTWPQLLSAHAFHC